MRQHLSLVLLALLISSSLALDTSCFTNSGAILETSSSPTWNTDRAVFNEKIDNQPAAIAYAHNQSQVQDIIKCARNNGMQAVPRGGGHGYEGYAVQNGQITLDVSNLTDFSSDGSSVTFGSGFRLGDLTLTMYLEANALLPAGTCSFVGSAGQILGGGTGLSVRSYGLACDQLLGLTMVDYEGNLIQASTSENEDLLWASCGGGGGNLGIVTSFTLKANSLSQVLYVTTAEIVWSGYDTAVSIFDKAQRFFPSSDKRMNAQLLIGFGSTSINLQWFGDQMSLTEQLNNSGIFSIPGYKINNMQEESFINATLRWGAGTMNIPTNSIYDLNTSAIPPSAEKFFTAASTYNQDFMSIEGIQTMVDLIANTPSNEMVFVEHKFLLGAVSERNSTDTAFAWRNSLYETQWFYFWLQGDQNDQANQWITNSQSKMAPYVGSGAYINYPSAILAATDSWQEAYYGQNLGAYRTVKTKYDPTNYFNNPLTPPPFPANATDNLVRAIAPSFSILAPSPTNTINPIVPVPSPVNPPVTQPPSISPGPTTLVPLSSIPNQIPQIINQAQAPTPENSINFATTG